MLQFMDLAPSLPDERGLLFPFHALHRNRRTTDVQQYIRAARKSDRYRVVCLCRAGMQLPLVASVREADGFAYLSRAKPEVRGEQAEPHSPYCFHADEDIGQVLGLDRSAVSMRDERLVLNWACLSADDSESSFGSGGGGGGQRVDHIGQLRELLWLLVHRAGMNFHHPSLGGRSLLTELFTEAAEVLLSAGPEPAYRTLADVILIPDGFDPRLKQRNERLIAETARSKRRRVLTLAILDAKAGIRVAVELSAGLVAAVSGFRFEVPEHRLGQQIAGWHSLITADGRTESPPRVSEFGQPPGIRSAAFPPHEYGTQGG